MQRRKKQLLGLVGLVMVAAMTILAYILPSPGASANSQSTTVRVQVTGEGTVSEIQILSVNGDEFDGADEMVLVTQRIKLEFQYAKATLVKVFLKNLGPVTASRASMEAEADEIEVPLGGSECSGPKGEFTMEDNHVEYEDGFTTCTTDVELQGDLISRSGVRFSLRAVAYNGSVNSSNEDSTDIFYLPAKFVGETKYDSSNGDPIVKIEMGSAVKRYELVIFDAKDLPVFGSSETTTGRYPAIKGEGWSGTDASVPKTVTVPLPFGQNDIENGEYQIVLVAYGSENGDDIVALSYTTADYQRQSGGSSSHPGSSTDPSNPDDPDNPNNPSDSDRPDVPDTGINLLSGLNISQRDYIITGLLAFGLVIGFAIFLVLRRNRR